MKQVQRQQLQQKLSPQQLQLMRLLQLPVTELEQAIKEEVMKNPLLEADTPENEESIDTIASPDNNTSDWDTDDEDFGYDYREHLESDPNTVRHEFVMADSLSFADRLTSQLVSRRLTDRQRLIANELIGTLDDAGYLGRDLALVTNDLAFRQGIDASQQEVEEVLRVIQSLEPAGIGARSLQECLRLQLERMDGEDTALAKEVVSRHFDDFAAHRYERICAEMGISQEQLESAAAVIRRLNPKPGSSDAESDSAANIVTPDIILHQHDGELQFYLNDGNLPRLSLNTYYTDMLASMEQQSGSLGRKTADGQAVQFLRARQADAQGFIDLLRQRHDTIERVMRYLVRHQRQFLLTGNPDLLQPLRQREVAEATGLDISTVSRMANSKYLQTDFGTIALKECFSKGIASDSGEEVSVEAVKQRLAEAVEAEDKHAPLSDDALTQLLNAQGYPLARRTVAKYREQLGIPVARLRRLLILLLFLIGHSAMGQTQMSYYDSLIAERLERASHAPAPKKETVKKKKETTADKKQKKNKTTVQKTTVPTAPAPQPRKEAETLPPEVMARVPLWYDAFPSNRVNPLGRTLPSTLPDEINIKLVNDSSDFCFPVKRGKTSNYGWRWNRGHHGVDIGLPVGEPVHVAFSGIVRVACHMGGYGNCIVVRHPNGLETLYGHLDKIHVKPGQDVKAGDIIGLGGNTGNSTGPHLHFECRFLYQSFDPEWILDFKTFSLRTRRLHLDKTYFGIRKPQKGVALDYKADLSIIKEPKKGRKHTPAPAFNIKDF